MIQFTRLSSLKNKVVILVLTTINVGCRKDPHIVIEPPVDNCTENNCIELTPPGPPGSGEVIDDNYITQGVQYLMPCFNPNNSDEIVFVRKGSVANAELVKYNIVNQSETVILDPMSLGRPQWGRQGTITFVYNDKHVWQIHEDGSNFQQLTTGVNDLYPNYSYDGNSIFYYRNKNYTNAELSVNPSLYEEYKMIVIDLNGNVIDSVTASNILPGNYFQKWKLAAHQADGSVYFEGGSGTSAGFYMLSSNLDTVFPDKIQTLYPLNVWTRDLVASSDYLCYSKFEGGLYKTNISNGTETVIKYGCNSRYYDHLSISPDGKKLLVEKVSRKRLDYYTVDEQHDLWLFDLETCEATEILSGDL